MTISNECIKIFKKAIDDYHVFDSVDRELKNPFSDNEFLKKIFTKNHGLIQFNGILKI